MSEASERLKHGLIYGASKKHLIERAKIVYAENDTLRKRVEELEHDYEVTMKTAVRIADGLRKEKTVAVAEALGEIVRHKITADERDHLRTALEEIAEFDCSYGHGNRGPLVDIAITTLATSNPSPEGECGTCHGDKYYSKPHPMNPGYVDRMYPCPDCAQQVVNKEVT